MFFGQLFQEPLRYPDKPVFFTGLTLPLSYLKDGDHRADAPRSRKCVFAGQISSPLSVAPLGGGPEERGRAQIRPPLYGAARVHRGVCTRARRLPTDGTRHGGGQEVPVSREFVSFLGTLINSTSSLLSSRFRSNAAENGVRQKLLFI